MNLRDKSYSISHESDTILADEVASIASKKQNRNAKQWRTSAKRGKTDFNLRGHL